MKAEIPSHWSLTTLGHIAKWGSGGTPNRSIPQYYGGNIPWFKTGELNDGVATEAEEFISEQGLKNSSAKVFPKGSVMIAMYGATIGKCAILGVDGSTNQACAVAQPLDGIEPRYLFHYLRSQKQSFIDKGKGGAQPNISQAIIKDHPFPFPPLPEQHLIVAKLDALFGRLDRLKVRMEKIPVLLRQFRQAVLTQAVTGKLTEEWRGRSRLPHWRQEILSQVCSQTLGKMLDKNKNKGVLTKYFRNQNVRWFEFDLSDVSEMRASDDDRKKFNIKNGDILVCEGGEPGRCAIWMKGDNKFIFQKALHRLRCSDSVLPEWIGYNLFLDAQTGELATLFTGTTIKHLTQKALAQYDIPLPSLEEQTEIIRRVESLFAIADRIEARYTALKERIDQLPQAILAKAFRGELVGVDVEKKVKEYEMGDGLSMAAEG